MQRSYITNQILELPECKLQVDNHCLTWVKFRSNFLLVVGEKFIKQFILARRFLDFIPICSWHNTFYEVTGPKYSGAAPTSLGFVRIHSFSIYAGLYKYANECQFHWVPSIWSGYTRNKRMAEAGFDKICMTVGSQACLSVQDGFFQKSGKYHETKTVIEQLSHTSFMNIRSWPWP